MSLKTLTLLAWLSCCCFALQSAAEAPALPEGLTAFKGDQAVDSAYTVLGLAHIASSEEIDQAFQRIVNAAEETSHHDKEGILALLKSHETLEDLQKRHVAPFLAPYKEAKFAYLTLSDPNSREQYDSQHNGWEGVYYRALGSVRRTAKPGASSQGSMAEDYKAYAEPAQAANTDDASSHIGQGIGAAMGMAAGSVLGVRYSLEIIGHMEGWEPIGFLLWIGSAVLAGTAGQYAGGAIGERIDKARAPSNSCSQVFRQDNSS